MIKVKKNPISLGVKCRKICKFSPSIGWNDYEWQGRKQEKTGQVVRKQGRFQIFLSKSYLDFFPCFFKELLRLAPIIISDSRKIKTSLTVLIDFEWTKFEHFWVEEVHYNVITFKVACLDVFAWFSISTDVTTDDLYFVGQSYENTESSYSEITNFSPGCGQYSESAPPSILESNFPTNDLHLFARWFCSIICPWRSRPIILVCWFDS